MELWRNWLTETERQFNGFFNQVMGTDSFGRVAGSYMDGYAVLQRSLNQGMERYLNTFNLPTHSDIVELGERLHNIEERLTTGSKAAAEGRTSCHLYGARMAQRLARRP